VKLLHPDDFAAEALKRGTAEASVWITASIVAAHYATGGRALMDEEVGALPEIQAVMKDVEEHGSTSPRLIGELFARIRGVPPLVP
jgi:hypothetical protein